MSYNQSRAEKSDVQLRKTGDRSGQNIGFAGGGVGGKGGGGGGKSGGGGAPPHQPLSSGNRSYKKSSHGQGQSRINPAGLGSESPAINRAPRAVQNGAHGPLLSQGLTTTSMPGGPKPGDSPMPRTTPALPKPPSSQFVSGNSDSAAAHTPVKGSVCTLPRNLTSWGCCVLAIASSLEACLNALHSTLKALIEIFFRPGV